MFVSEVVEPSEVSVVSFAETEKENSPSATIDGVSTNSTPYSQSPSKTLSPTPMPTGKPREAETSISPEASNVLVTSGVHPYE